MNSVWLDPASGNTITGEPLYFVRAGPGPHPADDVDGGAGGPAGGVDTVEVVSEFPDPRRNPTRHARHPARLPYDAGASSDASTFFRHAQVEFDYDDPRATLRLPDDVSVVEDVTGLPDPPPCSVWAVVLQHEPVQARDRIPFGTHGDSVQRNRWHVDNRAYDVVYLSSIVAVIPVSHIVRPVATVPVFDIASVPTDWQRQYEFPLVDGGATVTVCIPPLLRPFTSTVQ